LGDGRGLHRQRLGHAVAIDDNAGGLASVGRREGLHELGFGRDRPAIDRHNSVVSLKAGIRQNALGGDVSHHEAIQAGACVEPQAEVRATQTGIHGRRVAKLALAIEAEIGVVDARGIGGIERLSRFLARIAIQRIGSTRRGFVLLADPANGIAVLDGSFPRVAGDWQCLSGSDAA
jgi:hypothetical protein